jgi:hypothetical protein
MPKSKTTVVCVLASAFLVWAIFHDRQLAVALARDNAELRNQLNQSPGDATNAQIEPNNTRAQNKLSENLPSPALADSTDNSRSELERLRAAVEGLRGQTNEITALRTETRRLRAALRNSGTVPASGASDGAPWIEIVEAKYGTDSTNIDVSAELNARIRGDSLKAVASNNLKGDPEFGKSKRLTLIYRLGGATFTNAFNEGDIIVIQRDPTAN